MDSAGLRTVQQPLKDAYRSDPQKAVITLRAGATLGEETISCSVATGQALIEAGLHPATGGDGSLACSGDMLLQALVACAGVTLRAVATSLEIPIAATYPLDQVREAYERLATGHILGKIVLVP